MVFSIMDDPSLSVYGHENTDRVRGLSREDALATLALVPSLTQKIFVDHQELFVDLCGRWIVFLQAGKESSLSVLSATARVLPHAPHLIVHLEPILQDRLHGSDPQHPVNAWNYLSSRHRLDPTGLAHDQLQELLLATLRLLNFDNDTFAATISPTTLLPLLSHASRPVRYLSIRILALYLRAADSFQRALLERHLDDQAVQGAWEGKLIDYGFLT